MRVVAVSRSASHRFSKSTDLWIKLLANRNNRFDPQRLEHSIQLFVYQVYAAQKVAELIGFTCLNRGLCFECSLEIIEYR